MEQVEIWKDIPEYKGKYQVSNLGRVKSLQRWSGTKFYNREYILNNYVNKKNGYVYVYLTKNNKSKNIRLHRLVAQAFIPNPNNYLYINHKDCDRTNNNVNNLEWCTASYNVKYSFKYGKAKSNFRKGGIMLKIKDNVDLKKLKKFGFKHEDNDYRKEEISLDYIIDGDDKEIYIASAYGEFDKLDDTLYDLIKADLVEKVEE